MEKFIKLFSKWTLRFGLRINWKKTKKMMIGPRYDIFDKE